LSIWEIIDVEGHFKEKIFESVLSGIEQASDEFCKISGWDSLWYAPEYFLTCSIARQLASHKKGALTIEDCVRDTMHIAGANGPGRPRYGLRKDGRFDLVLWWKNDKPRAVIEVKHPLYNPTKVFKDDIVRIRDVLVASQCKDGSFQFGGLAFWTGADRPIRVHESVNHRITEKTEVLRKAASELIGNEFMVTIHQGKIHEVDDGEWGWAAVFLAIEPK